MILFISNTIIMFTEIIPVNIKQNNNIKLKLILEQVSCEEQILQIIPQTIQQQQSQDRPLGPFPAERWPTTVCAYLNCECTKFKYIEKLCNRRLLYREMFDQNANKHEILLCWTLVVRSLKLFKTKSLIYFKMHVSFHRESHDRNTQRIKIIHIHKTKVLIKTK